MRNQVRKGEKSGLTAARGGEELLPEFYSVFSRNMRDLGTPVYGAGLFAAALRQFPADAELFVVRAEPHAGRRRPAAARPGRHGSPQRLVAAPVQPHLRQHAALLEMLERAVERGQAVFDFGRSTIDGNTYCFKKQWGARPAPAVWQYYRPGGERPTRTTCARRTRATRADPHLAAAPRQPDALDRPRDRSRHSLTVGSVPKRTRREPSKRGTEPRDGDLLFLVFSRARHSSEHC